MSNSPSSGKDEATLENEKDNNSKSKNKLNIALCLYNLSPLDIDIDFSKLTRPLIEQFNIHLYIHSWNPSQVQEVSYLYCKSFKEILSPEYIETTNVLESMNKVKGLYSFSRVLSLAKSHEQKNKINYHGFICLSLDEYIKTGIIDVASIILRASLADRSEFLVNRAVVSHTDKYKIICTDTYHAHILAQAFMKFSDVIEKWDKLSNDEDQFEKILAEYLKTTDRVLFE
jgi:hypothetical protein